MHGFDDVPPAATSSSNTAEGPWFRELTRYHWFVLLVAALGWLFDTMDQQLFNLARVPAMRELLAPAPGKAALQADVDFYGGITTSIFLMGWAAGGLGFGIMGDRYGRAKTMLITILAYSAFTGLSALSWDIWSFCVFRFLTGLGVGGEFAVGVSLVAEVMPNRARPFALGLLQALSAVGNISAAIISIVLYRLEEEGLVGSAWRIMFVIGAGPALLAILIRRQLKEPEQWQALNDDQIKKKLGSYGTMFSHPTWRKNAIVGMLLAFSGVVGLWGIGFFSFDLIRSVFMKTFQQVERDAGEAEKDLDFVRMTVLRPVDFAQIKDKAPTSKQLLSLKPGSRDAELLYDAVLALQPKDEKAASPSMEQVAEHAGKAGKLAPSDITRLKTLLEEPVKDRSSFAEHAERIVGRFKKLNGRVGLWVGIASVMLNLGAFFGIYAFTYITHLIGRRPAFAISFVIAGASTAMVFGLLNEFSQIFWMVPLMGFCQLALFGGYAIYFPELFPTTLRSTGTSFCYNVGRFVAASGPFGLGLLTSNVFAGYPEPMRYAGVSMCSVFVIGLLVLPFAPETKGQPLPEE